MAELDVEALKEAIGKSEHGIGEILPTERALLAALEGRDG